MEPAADKFRFGFEVVQQSDFRNGTIEDRHRATTTFLYAIQIRNRRRKQAVCRCPDLMRSAIIYPQRMAAPPNVEAQLRPAEGETEYALPDIAGKKEGIVSPVAHRCEEADLRDGEILRFVDDNMFEWNCAAILDPPRQPIVDHRTADQSTLGHLGSDIFEYGPRGPPLLRTQSCAASYTRKCSVTFRIDYAPSIDQLLPFFDQELRCKVAAKACRYGLLNQLPCSAMVNKIWFADLLAL